MPLDAGTKLGPYEILSPLGAGGMGEVYLACDGKLDRQVAIKVLPETMARDKERVARFEREAKVVPDGRFIMIEPAEWEKSPREISVVLNWDEELRTKLPTGVNP